MPTGTANGLMGFVTSVGPIILIMGLLVVMMILPQRRQEKKVKAMMAGLKQGDRIRTIGGIYGRIDQVKEDIVVITVDPDQVRMTLSKGAISTVENSDIQNEAEISTVEDKK